MGSDTIYPIKCRQVFLLSRSIVARLPRYFVSGQPQCIILRGNNRQAIFAAERDLFFRDCLVEAAQRFGLGVHTPTRGPICSPACATSKKIRFGQGWLRILALDRWSSYAANALGKRGFDYDWLLAHPLYEAQDPDADSRRQAYRRLFSAAMKETDLKAIRDSLHKGWALGDDRFREEIALLSERRAAPLRKGLPRKNKG